MIKAVQSEEFSNEIERLQTLQRKDKAKGRTAKQVTCRNLRVGLLDNKQLLHGRSPVGS